MGSRGWTPESSAVAVDDLRRDLGEQLALDDVGAGGEDRPGILNVPQSIAAGTFEGAGLHDGAQHGVDVGVGRRPAGGGSPPAPAGPRARRCSGSVMVPSRTSVPRTLAGDLLVAAAVEDVVEDLEGEADEAPVLADGAGRLSPAPESRAPSAQAAANRSAVLRSQRRT